MNTLLQKITKKRLRHIEKVSKKRLDRCIRKYKAVCKKNVDFEELLREVSREEWKENEVKKKAITSKAYYAIFVGIICFLVSLIINIYYEIHPADEITSKIIESLLNVLNTIISMIIGIGVSTIVLDFFSYVQYTRERLKEIIIDKSFIKKLSDDEKKNIIFNAEESLYFKDGKILPNSLYADVKKKITPLLDSCYFSAFSIIISCNVDKEKGVIRKEILKSMKIMSNEDDAEFHLPFAMYIREANCEETEKPYEVITCTFQDEDITDKFKESQEEDKGNKVDNEKPSEDNVRYTQNYPFRLKKGENKIDLKVKTTVPINDLVYRHTVSLPCMQYKAIYTINSKGYWIDGYGFALENRSENHKKNVSYSRIGNSLTIDIDEWALPGEGVVFILNSEAEEQEKEQKKNV